MLAKLGGWQALTMRYKLENSSQRGIIDSGEAHLNVHGTKTRRREMSILILMKWYYDAGCEGSRRTKIEHLELLQ